MLEYDVFISYSSSDSDRVQVVVDRLRDKGFKVFYAKASIRNTTDWEEDIRVAIAESGLVLYFASPEARKSKYVKSELAIADARNVSITPVWISDSIWIDCVPMGRDFSQYIDLRNNSEQQMEDLIEVIVEAVEARNKGLITSAQGKIELQLETEELKEYQYLTLIDQIKDMDGDEVAAQLSALKNPSHQIRYMASQALAALRDGRSFEGLVVAVVLDTHERVQQTALSVLISLKDSKIVPLLILLCEQTKRAVLRQTAVQGIGVLKAQDGVDTLIELLSTDSDDSVRRHAASALRNFADAKVIEALIEALNAEEELDIVRTIINSLEQIKSRDAVEPILARIRDEPQLRPYGAGALGRIGDTRAVRPIIEFLEEENPAPAIQYITALGDLEDQQATSILIDVLKTNENPYLREHAARSLGKIADLRAFDALMFALKDDFPNVRHAAAVSLGELKSQDAFDSLVEALSDHADTNAPKEEGAHVYVRVERGGVAGGAVRGLAALGDTRAVEYLIPLLNAEDTVLRRQTAMALGQLGDPKAVEPLIETLRTANDPHLLRVTALALGDLATNEAQEALAAFRNTEAVDLLIDNIRGNNSDDYQKRVAEVLKLIGTEKALSEVAMWEESKSN